MMICALVASTGTAVAETYRWSQWQPDQEATLIGNRLFAERVCEATQGEICFEIYSGGALMPPKSHLQGIGDGVVQGGNVTQSYTPSDLPLSNALSAYYFVAPDPTVIGAAYADWAMHDPMALAEWQGHNVIGLGGFSTPSTPIVCNTTQPITELEQFQGLKIRFPSGANAKLAEDLGAVVVIIPAPEIYQALQVGQIDCAGIPLPWLNIENSLEEVSKSTTLLNWGTSFQAPLQILNRDFWQSLTNDQRGEMFKAAAMAHANVQVGYNNNAQRAADAAAGRGYIIAEPGDSIKEAVAEWVDAGVGDMAGVARDLYGVKDPEALFASFSPYVEKWRALIAEIEDPNDVDALTKVFYENMYDDLDPMTYGMN